MNNHPPTFAVVGQPNKGKSSVVATLARLSDIEISARSGTTQKSDGFDVKTNDNVLYRLYDTPGFQRARQVMHWLSSQNPDASQRAQTVQDFIQYAKSTDQFHDECELLTPIFLDKSSTGIIYVVDGSCEYHPSIEAELEILQWTGQPRMALINPIESDEFVEQWKQALGQYFSIVRVFNPVSANFDEQMQLLDGFMQLEGNWQGALQNAKTQLKAEKQSLVTLSSYQITLMIEQVLRLQIKLPIVHESMIETEKNALLAKFKKQIIELESNCFLQLGLLFKHHIQISSEAIQMDTDALFDKEQWFLWGLNQTQLVKYSAMAGFTLGAAIDLSVGGASLLLGAISGGVVGGVGSLAAMKYSDKWLKDIHLVGEKIVIGPIGNQAFMFALLGRSISFLNTLNKRNHANQNNQIAINDIEVKATNWSKSLSSKQLLELTKLLKVVNKRAWKLSEQSKMQSLIVKILDSQSL
ncbi:GTPase/DUF3482 domain-containing protein [Marinicellulosiphila megalodicopiae]|uniref:GTPase/DUF3482 domain-containing protein n=1 Tax=Marinicellulosiphila megalodicopiae TaxID=2724896 RepID=UPI003BB138CA